MEWLIGIISLILLALIFIWFVMTKTGKVLVP